MTVVAESGAMSIFRSLFHSEIAYFRRASYLDASVNRISRSSTAECPRVSDFPGTHGAAPGAAAAVAYGAFAVASASTVAAVSTATCGKAMGVPLTARTGRRR
ncbi:hypothetical protein [Streptomyces sp. NPDC088739]|uniref:hypothetical protein n=1 Tax=Streptomyces sp. NPDC088739 TaxID=3365882 RepID=UPI00382CCE5E